MIESASDEELWLATASLTGMGGDCCLGRRRSRVSQHETERDLPRMVLTSSSRGSVLVPMGWFSSGFGSSESPALDPSCFALRVVCGAGMKGRALLVSVVCSFGVTVVANFLTTTLSLGTAGPGQVAPVAVFAFDLMIQLSTSATLAGESLVWMFSHPKLQVCRQWKRPQMLTLPTFGMRSVNRLTLSHLA
jgi:hypothetical protein